MPGADLTAEAEIQRLRELLGLAREFGRLSLWERDRDTGEGRWDAEIFALFGLPVSESSPSLADAMSRMHPDDRERMVRAYRESLRQPGRHDLRYRVLRDDGRVTWIHSIWQVPQSGPRVAGVLIDDSDTAALARQHDHARTHLDLAADVAGMGLWSCNLGSGEQVWNATMKAIHGLPPHAPVPSTGRAGVSEHVLSEDRPRLAALLERMGTPQAPRTTTTWRIRRADGELRTLMGSARQLEGDPQVIAGVAIDISDVQAAEQARREKALAEQASRAKTEFLSRMSHELRTPLNAVLGFAELLRADPHEPPRPAQRERLDQLALAGRQLLGLIDEVLEIAGNGGDADDDGQAATAALQALLARPAAAPATQPPAPGPDDADHDLVYVEDNPVNLMLVQQIVALRPRLRLHGAASVHEGEALVRKVQPSLVLVDLHLPDGDGIELLRRLRSGPEPVQAPCIVLSADAQPQQVRRALEAGFEDYWTKPVSVSEMLGALDRRLSA